MMHHLFALIALLVCTSHTRAAHMISVAPDGSADYKTPQEAIAAAPENSTECIDIHLKPGTYPGPFIVPKNKPNITLRGDDPVTTILTWDRNVRDPIPEGNDKFN